MSGITPLIDTLMHQVLGRNTDSLQRSLNAPVQPVPPGEGPRALQGDASLDGRPASQPLGDLKRLPLSPDGQRLPSQSGASGGPSSTQTHLSPAARTIADVLLRFPAPPAVMRPEAPLMTTQDAPQATTLATRLEASIRDSGLFYESHLKRWFQGDMSRQQLLREPQMQAGPRPLPPSNLLASSPASLSSSVAPAPMSPPAPGSLASVAATLTPTPSASPVVGAGSSAILPNTVLVPVAGDNVVLGRPAPLAASPPPSMTALQPEQQESAVRSEASIAREQVDVATLRGSREIVHESLQSIVRQQLDMLVTPTIRWEGDVWAGIFMALVVNLPGRDEGREKDANDTDAEDSWHSDMQLEVPNLGAFSVSLRLYHAVLSIDIASEDVATFQRLEQGAPTLEERLSALDFRKVLVKARFVTAEEPYDDFR